MEVFNEYYKYDEASAHQLSVLNKPEAKSQSKVQAQVKSKQDYKKIH